MAHSPVCWGGGHDGPSAGTDVLGPLNIVKAGSLSSWRSRGLTEGEGEPGGRSTSLWASFFHSFTQQVFRPPPPPPTSRY